MSNTSIKTIEELQQAIYDLEVAQKEQARGIKNSLKASVQLFQSGSIFSKSNKELFSPAGVMSVLKLVVENYVASKFNTTAPKATKPPIWLTIAKSIVPYLLARRNSQ